MSYTDVFGGNLIFPSRVSYLALTTAIDVALQWPTEQQITGQNVVADIIDVTTTAPGLTVDMPDAQIASTGNKVTFNNVGGNAFTVRDITGGTIQTVQPGEQWVLSLTDNSTDMGAWTTFQLGAQVAVASASALAGAGIKAIAVLLNQKIDSDVQGATPFTIVDGDRATCQIYTAGAGICNLPGVGVVGNDWFFMLRNSGSGTLSIVPPGGTIDGAADINLDPGGSTFIFTDGVNFFTIGLTVASTIAFDFVSIPVPGSGDFVLSGANLNRISYRFTGALTGNRRIVVPNTTQQYWMDNQTTGAFTLSISTAAQVGPPSVNPGDTVIFYCDAVDVINAVNTAAIALPVLISQGGTSATTAPNALLNLGAAASIIEIQTAALSGLSGGGDLTANRPLLLDVNNLTAEVTIDTAADFLGVWDADAGAMRKFLISDVVPSPDSLIDSGGNIALFAAGSSVVQLRSVGNADAVARRLNFTHQDGTLALTIGQTSFSEEMSITNNINHPDGDILINVTHASAVIELQGRFQVNASGPRIRGSANNNASLNFTDTSYNGRYSMSFPSSDMFLFAHPLTNGLTRFQGVNAGTITRIMLELNPNDGPHLFNDGVDVARVIPFASGGFEVNNTLTGAGFERVATIPGDVPGQTIMKVKNVSTTRGATGVSNDPQLSGWVLEPGYYRFEGSIAFTVTPANGGIDLNWSTVGGSVGINFGQIITRDDDLGVTVGNAIEASFIPTTGGDTILTYATRNDQTRAFIHGAIEVTATVTVGFQWAPRLASNLTMAESSWIMFQKIG